VTNHQEGCAEKEGDDGGEGLEILLPPRAVLGHGRTSGAELRSVLDVECLRESIVSAADTLVRPIWQTARTPKR
jgi:hypothetical protein